jgi:hypothetical protein
MSCPRHYKQLAENYFSRPNDSLKKSNSGRFVFMTFRNQVQCEFHLCIKVAWFGLAENRFPGQIMGEVPITAERCKYDDTACSTVLNS